MSCFLVILILAAIEGYFRFFYIETDSMLITLSSKKWMEKYYERNNQGFRDRRDFSPIKPRHVFRIGILGDSFVEGQGIKNPDNRFSNILENLINKKFNISCEVYNLGRSGADISEEKEYFLQEGNFFQFNALILSVVELDDFLSGLSIRELSDEYLDISERNSTYAGIIRYFKNSSYAFSFFYAQFTKFRENFIIKKKFVNIARSAILNKDNWENFIRHIYDIQEICNKNDTAFYVISFPLVHFDGDKDIKELEIEYRERFQRQLVGLEIKHIFLNDLLSQYDYRNLIVSRFDIHPNELANKIAANEVLSLIQEQFESVNDLAPIQ